MSKNHPFTIISNQFGWQVQQYTPNATRIIDTQDLHCLRYARQKALEAGKSIEEIKNIELSLTDESLLREISSIHRSDLTFVVSHYERSLLISKYGIPPHKVNLFMKKKKKKKKTFFLFNFIINLIKLELVSFYYDVDTILRNRARHESKHRHREHFVMLGNFRHGPNHDAVHWTYAELWPKIRAALPDACMHVYGMISCYVIPWHFKIFSL